MRAKFKVGDMVCHEHNRSRIGYVTKFDGGRPRSYIHIRWFDQTHDNWYSDGPVFKSLIKIS
jgi:hypothetical protein